MFDFDIGDIVAGKYEIKQILGVGGMGKVYRARQVDLGRDVALKIPSEAVLQSPEVMARFSREAKTVAQLSHENIVQVYEYYHEGSLAFISMEYVEGEDLKAFVARSPKDLTVGDMGRILEMACEGISHAHEHGIVHRDIKPHNIMVAKLPRGKWRVKVMDFGIAHIDSAAQFAEMGGQLTQTGQALGTPTYMSPEQIRGANISHLSDIYSFGCVIYYSFTLGTVFSGSGLTVAVSHLNEQPPSIRARVPGISEKFDELVLKCLEKDPTKRPQHAAELGNAILDSLAGMTDVPMTEIWKYGGRSSDPIIPIMGSGSSGTDSSQQLVEVQTQQTLAHTDPFDDDVNSAKTSLVNPIAEAPTQTTPSGGSAAAAHWDPESKTVMVAAPSPGTSSEQAPTKTASAQQQGGRKPIVIWGVVALSCLLVGVLAAITIGGRDSQVGGSQIADDGSSTVLPGDELPEDDQVAIVITSTPEPRQTPGQATPPPESTPFPDPTPAVQETPEPQPTPTPDPRMRTLLTLRDRANDSRDFITQVEYWGRVIDLYTPQDEVFSREVLQVADNLATRAVRNPEMIQLGGGLFTMGNNSANSYANERPVHNVRLAPYRIGRYEVTALEFATFLNEKPDIASVIYKPDASSTIYYDEEMQRYLPKKGKELHPANRISWVAANDYVNWLARETGRVFRLPTEAEWERAARGSPPASYPWGESAPNRMSVNFLGKATVAVNALGEGARSMDGMYHMAGNVAEWVFDWYGEDYYASSSNTIDPQGPDLEADRTAKRVNRGGSFLSTEQDLVASRRFRLRPEEQGADLGFRLAETPSDD